MWIIKPYKSVGPLEFGMTPHEVANLIGPPSDTQGNPMPESAPRELREKSANVSTEFRFGKTPEDIKPSVQYRGGRVSSFEIYDTIPNVIIDGFHIFENTKRIVNEWFLENSTHYAKNWDGYVFLDFGISMSLDDVWQYSPSINVFTRGEFDESIADTTFDYTIIKK